MKIETLSSSEKRKKYKVQEAAGFLGLGGTVTYEVLVFSKTPFLETEGEQLAKDGFTAYKGALEEGQSRRWNNQRATVIVKNGKFKQ